MNRAPGREDSMPMRTQAPITVLHGKKPAMGALFLLGLVLASSGLVNLLSAVGVLWASLGFAVMFLVGALLVVLSVRQTFQTVAVFPDRLVWKRFPSEVVLPYANIRGVERTVQSESYESFDEVRLTMTDGSVYTISHLADGNDLVRALNTYGARVA